MVVPSRGLGAARNSRQCLRGNENAAVPVERTFGVISVTRNLLNQFTICLENRRVAAGKMEAIGVISQRLMAYAARHYGTLRILHQEANAALIQVLVVEACKRHLFYLTSISTTMLLLVPFER